MPSVNHGPTPNAAILKRTPSIDSGSDDSGDNSADLPDNFHSNPSDRGDYHDEPTDVDPLSTNPFDGDLSRDEAEREAWALVSKRYRQH